MGYLKETKAYYFYHQSENKTFVAREGVFLEKEHFFKKISGSNVHLEEIQEEQQTEIKTPTPFETHVLYEVVPENP